ncbi:MAG: hypothetical protein ACKPI7_07200 [Microcystis panniformis]
MMHLRRDSRTRPRGGSWYNNPNNCRSAYRNNNNRRDNNNNNNGFRVVCGAGITLYSQSWQVAICQECIEESSLFLRCRRRHPKIKPSRGAW